MKKTIQVFEYDHLPIGERGFSENHFDHLVRFNEKHRNRYYTVGFRKITFQNFVGILQVGKLLIEILPKADRRNDKQKWRNALITMLRECHKLNLEHVPDANLQIQTSTLVDLYFYSFLVEVESLVHYGLTKRYKKDQSSLPYLKGRLLIAKQIKENIAHKERFFSEHHIYSVDNTFNQVLKKALSILRILGGKPDIRSKARTLLLAFENVQSMRINSKTFKTLEYNRKTIAYKEAINLARLIILNFAPSIKSGDYPVLGILFDMNKLFEEFVYMRLKKSEVLFHTLGLKISSQTRRLFWASKTIRPDILLEISKPSSKKVIMDTKWKMLSTPYPTDDDLKQMYTYNLQFGAAESVLLYPKKDFSSQSPQLFFSAEACPDYRHHCRLYFIDMFDGEGKIKKNLGIMILSDVLHCYPN